MKTTSKQTPSKRTKTEGYYECPRCNINSLGRQMCPCPRGSCEAELVGKVVTIVEVILTKKKKNERVSKKEITGTFSEL